MDTNEKLNEASNETFTWSALEYEDKVRSSDWFWALGIIVVTSSITAIIFDNYFFAALLILCGLLLGFFAIKKPEMVHYELNDKGLKINNRLYPYENIKSFYVRIDRTLNTTIKPLFFIHTERVFMPIITIPIKEEDADDIHTVMTLKNVNEVEMKEHPSEKIMEILGF